MVPAANVVEVARRRSFGQLRQPFTLALRHLQGGTDGPPYMEGGPVKSQTASSKV